MFHDLLGVLCFVEPVIPALHARGRGVGDVLPTVCPVHLIPLALHQREELLLGGRIPHTLVDGVHQPELPALTLGGRAVLPTAHPLPLDLPFRRRQDRQTVGGAGLIVDGPVGLQASGALVEFFPVQETDAVDDQMAMQVVGVDVGSYQYLEVGELPLGQFQSDGVGLLGRQVIRLCKGLDEVVVLPPVRFSKPFFGELHLGEDRLGGAVPAGHQPLSLPQRLFLLADIASDTAERTPASAPVLDGGEGSHLVDTSSISFASSLIG